MSEEYVSIGVAAKILGTKERCVRSFIRRQKGVVKHYKQSKRITKISRADLERHLVNDMLCKMNETVRV